MPHFVLYDEDANFIGRAKHVMLAPGHGPLSFPPVLAKARNGPGDRRSDRAGVRTQAVRPRRTVRRAGRRHRVGQRVGEHPRRRRLGAGLTRNAQPETQDLNVPRCLFESRGIDAYVSLPFDERIKFLGEVLRGTRPDRREWLSRIENGQKEGRFDALVGEIDEVGPGEAGLRIHVSNRHGEDPGWLDVTGITAGTGFNKSVLTIPLLRRLIEFYHVPVVDGRLQLQTNCGVPGLDQPDSRLCCMGLIANNVIPHGDTIAGSEVHRPALRRRLRRAEHLKKRSFPSRLGMQVSMGREVARALRKVSPTQQLA